MILGLIAFTPYRYGAIIQAADESRGSQHDARTGAASHRAFENPAC
jgi:hypothetical protein